MSTRFHPRNLIDWCVAARPLAGQSVSGDLHLVKAYESGVLLAAVDGVGHGDEATLAAQAAVTILERHTNDQMIPLVRRCHEALVRTRGAAMTVATLHPINNTMTWIGVGNVEGRLLRSQGNCAPRCESVLLRSGLVGFQLPALQTSVLPIAPGDLLIFATDGIHPAFELGVRMSDSPGQIADWILNRHFKGTDDALVLVARYLGMQHES